MSANDTKSPTTPPVPPRSPRIQSRHGETFVDDYAWLSDRNDPRVIEHLRAENGWTERVLAPLAELRERLYREMLGRIQETDLSVPEGIDEYWYYTRSIEGQAYPIFCRKHGSLDSTEQVLLDQNALAEGRSYLQLGALEPSPDHTLLAYSVDDDGSERFRVRFRDLSSGDELADEIPEAYYGLEWAEDGRHVFYVTTDCSRRPNRVWRHELGTARDDDQLIFEENDEAFFVSLQKTRSRRFLLISVDSKTSSEVWFLDAANPCGRLELVDSRRPGVEYGVEHHGERFFILTNDSAVNFKLVEAPVSSPGRDSWRDLLVHRPEVLLEQVEAFAEHLVVVQRERGLKSIRIFDLPGLVCRQVAFEEPTYSLALHRNPEFHTQKLRFTFASFVTPRTVFEVDLTTLDREILKEQPVLGGYDRRRYATERRFVRAPDGAEIPLSLVWRPDRVRPQGNPCVLYGYGAYGATIDAGFDSTRLSLLDRGFVWAIAHVRGGGELGRPWYDAGKLLDKHNTFSDFIACAENLIETRRTTPEKLVIHGASAGGLLVGAVLNLRPELFSVAVTRVPFVDVLTTMLDASLPLTVTEWEEWGNPSDPQVHAYIRSYSPYDNVGERPYPHLWVTAGLNDPRVGYWEPAKWVARLREVNTRDSVIALKTELDAGHGGVSGRYERLRDLADELAFVLDRLGMADVVPD